MFIRLASMTCFVATNAPNLVINYKIFYMERGIIVHKRASHPSNMKPLPPIGLLSIYPKLQCQFFHGT